MKNKSKFVKLKLTLLFSALIFLILSTTILLIFLMLSIIHRLGIIPHGSFQRIPLFIFALISILFGTVISVFFSKIPINPIQKIMSAIEQVANGDYSVRIHLKGTDELTKLCDEFNKMASELQSVEILRTDFINDFSHEFKTPIVSIRGFAKLLQNEELTAEQRNEYLEIIVNESERLSELATNVLLLSKIEKQSILIDKTDFNLSEQIRIVSAMLYQKWDEKHINIDFEGNEVNICANEELLKQVWINLIDNAIKFSPEYSTVNISVLAENENIIVYISDQGEGIDFEKQKHIFDKFFQGDSSHTADGNGLGLAIAKKIIDLHGGTISIKNSDNSGTTFMITLHQ